MAVVSDDSRTDAVTRHCLAVLGSPSTWLAPSGWPNSLALCVLDSIWSLDSNYRAVVFPLLDRYRDFRRVQGGVPETDSAADLIYVFNEVGGPEGFAVRIGNRRPAHSKAGAPLKAASVLQSARLLSEQGVVTTSDLLKVVSGPHDALKRAWRSVPGNGTASWRYLLMLAGDEHVKPDRMVARFVATALGLRERDIRPALAADLLTASADVQGVSRRGLDHAVWRYQGRLTSRRSSRR